MTDLLIPGAGADTLHGRSRPHDSWTTTNVGEAVPGVQTPLGWSIWGPAGEAGLRGAFHTIGVLDQTETGVPDNSEDRIFSLFYGRIAMHLDLLCEWADRIPGTSGEAMATQLFTFVPPAYRSRPQRRYYPRVLARAGLPWIQGPRNIHAQRAATDVLWRDSIGRAATLDTDGARRLLLRGSEAFATVIYHHTVLTLGAVQPAYDLLVKVCGDHAQELMGGHGGHEETAMLHDLWDCSRDRLGLEQFIGRYGYHGPREGDISTTVWREDPTPLHRLLVSYRDQPDNTDPRVREQRQIAHREAVEQRFLRGLPAWRRPLARATLALGARYLPLRGVGKVAFLQGMDVTRAAARALGELAAQDSALDNPEDIFFLTVDDLRHDWPSDAGKLARERRAYHAQYLTFDLPELWQGEPQPVRLSDTAGIETTIAGIGASPGIVEGPARVILDPADADVEPLVRLTSR